MHDLVFHSCTKLVFFLLNKQVFLFVTKIKTDKKRSSEKLLQEPVNELRTIGERERERDTTYAEGRYPI